MSGDINFTIKINLSLYFILLELQAHTTEVESPIYLDTKYII